MFLEVNNELINLNSITKIRKSKHKSEFRLLFLSDNNEVFNIHYITEAEMVITYDKLKTYLISKKDVKRIGDL